MFNLRKTKGSVDIAKEWDAIAERREDQICSGKDHSAKYVLGPAILRQVSATSSLVDIGCGTGWLTVQAEALAAYVVGVDPSSGSISIARQRHAGHSIRYYSETIEFYARTRRRFDVAISNMAASSAPNIGIFLAATRKILRRGSIFIFTVPHPCFWPQYSGYAMHQRFDYRRSLAVESEFRLKSDPSGFSTTHFHRPLEAYVSALVAAKFSIEAVEELNGRGYHLPRFMLFRSRAV